MKSITMCLVLLSVSTMAFGGLAGYKEAADFTNTIAWDNTLGWVEYQIDFLYNGAGVAGLKDNRGICTISSYDYEGINVSGGILSYDGIGYEGFSGIWPTPIQSGANGLVTANGFTVEYGGFALQGTTAGNGLRFTMYNNTTWPGIQFWIRSDNTIIVGGWSGPSYTVADVTTPHNYRMAVLGDDGTGRIRMNIYQDQTLVVGNVDVGEVPTGPEGEITLWTATEWELSDQISWQLDYIRYDTNGGYAPIPEPAMISILGLGGLLALRKRK